MAEGIEVRANQLGLTVYFRSPEPKDVQRQGKYSVWVRYQMGGRVIEHSQWLEPSDVQGYTYAKWELQADRFVALGVRKDHQDPRISDAMERMFLIGEEADGTFTIGPDGLVSGRPKPTDCGEVVVYYQRNEPIYFHFSTNFRPWTNLPGLLFELEDTSGYVKIRLPLQAEEWITGAAINDGRGWWDNNQGRDYSFFPGTYTIENGAIHSGEPKQTK